MRRTSTTSTCTVHPSSVFSRPVTPSACLPVSSSSSRAACAATWVARAGGRGRAFGALRRSSEPPFDSAELDGFLAAGFLEVDLLTPLFFAALARLLVFLVPD